MGNLATRLSQVCPSVFQEERAYAPLANRVMGNIKVTAKLLGRITVQDVNQCPIMKVAERPMEEARPDGAVRLDDRRDPGRVAARSDG